MDNPFVLNPEEYVRDIRMVPHYIDQSSLFLSIMTGDPFDECKDFVVDQIKPGGQFALKNPTVISVRQDTPANREAVETTFMGYLKEINDRDLILSPSLVGYERPERMKSISADFVEGGIKGRKIAKDEMKQAKIAGDTVLEYIKDCEQNAKKIGINSISGMHGFSGNILYVHSGHSSLTSLCRTATGYGNSWNEKYLMGSRHYYDARVTLYNVLTLINTADYTRIAQAMEKYSLRHPTVEETKACIMRSVELYFRPNDELEVVMELIDKLLPIQRSAVVYVGDAFHMALYNDAFMREFIGAMVNADETFDGEPMDVLDKLDDDRRALTNYLNADIMAGTKWDKVAVENPEGMIKLARTAKGVNTTLDKYRDFIRAFWVVPTLGHSVAQITSIMRRCVLASDTDSTIFTTQWWVKWFTGSYARSRQADGVWYTMTYMTTQGIIHILAKLSANVGVSPKDLFRLAMKNEFGFPVFVLTPRAKTYFASRNAREGDVFAKNDMEIKGVGLRPSKITPEIVARAHRLMEEIVEAADANKKMTLDYVYGVIYEWEQRIKQAIVEGDSTFFETGQIKELYKKMEASPYVQYELWNEVFAPKYGETPPPPYSFIKVPIDINNRTEMDAWYESMEDRELALRFKAFMYNRGKEKASSLKLPTSIVAGRMPAEILAVVNLRKLTYQMLESFYILLECLGVYQIDDKHIRLVSDFYRV